MAAFKKRKGLNSTRYNDKAKHTKTKLCFF